MYMLLITGYGPGGPWNSFEMFRHEVAAREALDRYARQSDSYKRVFGPVIGPILTSAIIFKVDPLTVYPPDGVPDGSVPAT